MSKNRFAKRFNRNSSVQCGDCGGAFFLPRKFEVGKKIICIECSQQFKILKLSPLRLEPMFDQPTEPQYIPEDPVFVYPELK